MMRSAARVPRVHMDVFVQVRFLSKCLGATHVSALKWSFSGVDSQVVEEIVPLSEVQLATFEVTLQNFNASVCARILVFENSVASGSRHFNLVNSDFVHVQRGTILYMNRNVWRDFLSELVI